MAQTRFTLGADVAASHRNSGPDGSSPQRPGGDSGARPVLFLGATPDTFVSTLDRLIARIESGTAMPEDVDGLPEGLIEYMYNAITLSEMGMSDADWEVTPTGGILVRNAAP